MPLKYLLAAAAIALLTLSACTSTSSSNTTYAQPQGIGPVRGSGISGYQLSSIDIGLSGPAARLAREG